MASSENFENPLDWWNDRWQTRNIRFHKTVVHPALQKFYEALTSGDTNKEIFVPLCGKSLDLEWLYRKGHKVIGVEGVETAVLEFFQDHSIAYDVDKSDSGRLHYSTTDKRLNLYCGDLFTFSSDVIGKVDCIWDRGSLVAIPIKDRPRYANLMKTLLRPGFHYLLEAFDHDGDDLNTPRSIKLEEVNQLFGDFSTIEVLDHWEPDSHVATSVKATKVDVYNVLMKDKCD